MRCLIFLKLYDNFIHPGPCGLQLCRAAVAADWHCRLVLQTGTAYSSLAILMPFRAYSANVFFSNTTFPSRMDAWMKCRLPSLSRHAIPTWVISSPGVLLTKQMMSPSRILSSISGILPEGMQKYAVAVSRLQFGPADALRSFRIVAQPGIIVPVGGHEGKFLIEGGCLRVPG